METKTYTSCRLKPSVMVVTEHKRAVEKLSLPQVQQNYNSLLQKKLLYFAIKHNYTLCTCLMATQ